MNLTRILLKGDEEEVKFLKSKLRQLPPRTITLSKKSRKKYQLEANAENSVNIYPIEGEISEIELLGENRLLLGNRASFFYNNTQYNIYTRPRK